MASGGIGSCAEPGGAVIRGAAIGRPGAVQAGRQDLRASPIRYCPPACCRHGSGVARPHRLQSAAIGCNRLQSAAIGSNRPHRPHRLALAARSRIAPWLDDGSLTVAFDLPLASPYRYRPVARDKVAQQPVVTPFRHGLQAQAAAPTPSTWQRVRLGRRQAQWLARGRLWATRSGSRRARTPSACESRRKSPATASTTMPL
jgi:hypothetical protein